MSTMKKKKNNSSSLLVLVLILHCFAVFAAAADTDPAEVTALKSIKASFGDPANNLKTWGSGDPCNSPWKGVFCFNNAGSDGYLHVQELRLIGLHLTGNIAPAFGQLLQLEILDVMWNNVSGNIPKEIGNIKSLKLLLLNGNKLSGPLPEELGFLPVLDRIQIDQNRISGPLPKTFANLNKTKHFHMNNNSISGEIPKEFYRLPSLVHMLLDNNNLTGELPSELAEIPNLLILQLDNNQLNSEIPPSFVKMSKLLKLSLRNCSLRGSIPDFSHIPDLGYLDLSYNGLTGNIPSQRLSQNITTIDLSHNKLNGSIPVSFADLPLIQRISLDNNKLSGSVPSNIGLNVSFNSTATLQLDYRNNSLSSVNGSLSLPPNISLWLVGNPVCNQGNTANLSEYCGTRNVNEENSGASNNGSTNCPPNSCSPPTDYIPFSGCLCATPLVVGYRLKSPGFSKFMPYMAHFEKYITSGLNLTLHQVYLRKYEWEPGPRLAMILEIFPTKDASPRRLNESETNRLVAAFAGWEIPDDDAFGPYEWINITINGLDTSLVIEPGGSGLSSGAIAGIVIGSILGTAIVFVIIMILVLRQRIKYGNSASKRKLLARRKPIKIAGVKDFTFEEMALATNNFSVSMQVGQGGYGKVYKGLLGDGTVVAVKRAQEGSLQGEKEFSTEIELLSRVHHRNLVSLLGFCDDEGEQMLVYEFMENGTLRDCLSGNSKMPLSFEMRLRIAIGSAKGILYLHTEANPPIFHRDIKASNILLDDRYNAKVADFGLSRLAPVPDLDGSTPGHVSTVVKGTPGYLDPEYFLTHKLTDKSDVYSFGVVLLELLTGMQPISHGKNIVREVNMARSSGMILSVVDPRMGPYPSECLEPLVRLAINCCQDETDARPSMADVVRELEKILQVSPSLDSTPMDSVEIDISAKQKVQKETFVEMTTQNPYVSSDVPGSDLLSGTIPNIAPR